MSQDANRPRTPTIPHDLAEDETGLDAEEVYPPESTADRIRRVTKLDESQVSAC